MTGFGGLLAEAESLDDGLALTVPETWHQGRTAYGGLSASLCLEATADFPRHWLLMLPAKWVVMACRRCARRRWR